MNTIPQELLDRKQWVCWTFEKSNNGRTTKKPIDPYTGRYARSNDSSTWSDYDTAAIAGKNFSGIGFMLGNGIMGVDIDDVPEELERYKNGDYESNIIFEFIETFKSYAEISPSGNGIHILCKGEIPGDRRRKGNIEFYSELRFLTFTNNTIGNYNDGIATVSKANMKRVYNKYLESNVVDFKQQHVAGSIDLSESEIISRILGSRSSEQFKAFMNGGWEAKYDSQSEADLAFANLLAFWCGRDYVKMDSIFRQSSLIRNKWDKKHGQTTYGEATLNKAINDTPNIYTPKREAPKYDINFVEQKPKQDKLPSRSWDDTGNAQRFLDHFGTLARFSFIDKKWYFYNGSYWEVDFRGNVRTLVDVTVEAMAKETIRLSGDEKEDEELQKAFNKHIKRSRSNAGKNAMMDELKHRLPIMPDEFDNERMLLNTKNGYIDLSSGVLHDHDVSKMFSRETNTEFTDKTDAPEWDKFMYEIFDGDMELIRYLQKAVGYSLTSSTREQIMFILHGGGRNGKSIFLETISDIMGSYANSMQASTIMARREVGINSDIARLKGARLVTSSEPNEGFRFDEGLIKQLTGGDKVTARKLYGEEFEFNPEFKLWLATNHKPIIRGTDDGIWRRMIVIPFNVQIPIEKVDKDLKYKLQREASGILNWAIEGCLLWQREGLKTPQTIQESVDIYRSEMDVIVAFVDDCLHIDKNRTVQASEVYKLYKQWATDNAQYLMSSTAFGKEFSKKFERKRMSNGNVYVGVATKYYVSFG